MVDCWEKVSNETYDPYEAMYKIIEKSTTTLSTQMIELIDTYNLQTRKDLFYEQYHIYLQDHPTEINVPIDELHVEQPYKSVPAVHISATHLTNLTNLTHSEKAKSVEQISLASVCRQRLRLNIAGYLIEFLESNVICYQCHTSKHLDQFNEINKKNTSMTCNTCWAQPMADQPTTPSWIQFLVSTSQEVEDNDDIYKYLSARLISEDGYEDTRYVAAQRYYEVSIGDNISFATSFSYAGKVSNHYCFQVMIESSDAILVLVDDDGYIVAIDNDNFWTLTSPDSSFIITREHPRCGKFNYLETPVHFMYYYFDKSIHGYLTVSELDWLFLQKAAASFIHSTYIIM